MSNNKYKVLIVEDEANICSFIETLLTTNDYQALVAHTCTMGLTLFASHNPDLVILDLGLPTLDGLTVLKEWRKVGRPAPVLILSARSQWEERVEGIEVGADDYVVKQGWAFNNLTYLPYMSREQWKSNPLGYTNRSTAHSAVSG